MAASVAVVAIIVAAAAVYLADGAAQPEPSNAANALANTSTSAAQTQSPMPDNASPRALGGGARPTVRGIPQHHAACPSPRQPAARP